MTQLPPADYATPHRADGIRYRSEDGALFIEDGRPPIWRLVVAPLLSAFSAPLGMLSLIGFLVSGSLRMLVAMVLSGVCAIAMLIVFIDDLAKTARPGTIIVRDGWIWIDQLRWRGRQQRHAPVTTIRDIRISQGSATVHALGSLVIRFHNAPSASVLTCRNKAEAEHMADLLRRAVGLTPQAALQAASIKSQIPNPGQ